MTFTSGYGTSQSGRIGTYEGGRILDGPALMSPDFVYRYTLRRTVSLIGGGRCLFIMLNPSTADARINDPTIRRCMGFAQRWGYAELMVANLFAYRSTDPAELREADDPVGEHNDQAITGLAALADVVICAWGNAGALAYRDLAVLDLLAAAGADQPRTAALAINATSRHPKHPLYARADCDPIPWGRRDADLAARAVIA